MFSLNAASALTSRRYRRCRACWCRGQLDPARTRSSGSPGGSGGCCRFRSSTGCGSFPGRTVVAGRGTSEPAPPSSTLASYLYVSISDQQCVIARVNWSAKQRVGAFFSFFSFFFHLTHSRWTSSLPSCLWSHRTFPSLPGSRLTIFYRDASSALLQLVNQWLNFTYSRSHAFRYETRKKTNPTLVRIELTTSALLLARVRKFNS